LNQAIEELQQMYGTTEAVEREIQSGDYILVDLNPIRRFDASRFATSVRRMIARTSFPSGLCAAIARA